MKYRQAHWFKISILTEKRYDTDGNIFCVLFISGFFFFLMNVIINIFEIHWLILRIATINEF